ncbi:Hypp8342 [Branchiostoma lanceolatum]|uniref:Hypp8342 protein n=1 Tax=Branchiostoma lanceolatum TaxID=7740 RepID=A0A8J9Z7T6_BRALA|nr:Hypp8342 [Branchiostoma lanceolatum]
MSGFINSFIYSFVRSLYHFNSVLPSITQSIVFVSNTGVNFGMRKIAANTSPRNEIEQDGDSFKVKTIAAKTKEIKITPTLDGGKLRFTIDSLKGDLVMKAADGTTYTRIFARQ